jgi:uncharacterized membrane protein YtjA (UPF0391 family)
LSIAGPHHRVRLARLDRLPNIFQPDWRGAGGSFPRSLTIRALTSVGEASALAATSLQRIPTWHCSVCLRRPAPLLETICPDIHQRRQVTHMLYYAAVFFVIAIVAAILGFGGIAAGAAGIAKILFFVFLLFALVAVVSGLLRGA